MKNFKKFITVIMIIAFFINPSLSRAMNTENKESEKLYLAYCENNDVGVSIRVVDGKGHDGKDNIVYCYDRNNKYPSINGGYEQYKTYYTKIDSYLDTNDPYADKYGKDKKERIASVLYQGYPNDNSGLIQKNRLSEYEAMKMTQYLIWDITENVDYGLKPYDSVTQKMADYYNDLLKLSKIDKFKQGKLDLIGKLEFSNKENNWSTDKLYTTGDKGEFSFKDLPEYMEVRDYNTHEKITGNVSVGQEFYIQSSQKPSEDTLFKITYKYKTIKFYFYKFHSGGMTSGPYQDLVRAEEANEINEIPLHIKINGNFEEVPDVPEQVKVGSAKLIKVDKDNKDKIIQGAKFELLREDQKTIVKENLETDKNGEIIVDNLEPGTYYFKEVQAALGYVLDDKLTQVKVEENKESKVVFENEKKTDSNNNTGTVNLEKTKSKLKILKVDENNKPLENVEFTIKDKLTDKIIASKLTDKNGVAQFELDKGNYAYQETAGLKGYVIDNKEYPLEITKNEMTIEKKVVNQHIKGSLEITKVDAIDKKELSDAEFIVKDKDGNIKGRGKTDNNGVVRFENLTYGEYKYQEVEAPNGYMIDNNEYNFIISEDKKVVKVTATNGKITSGIKIIKVDENNQPLSNVEFTIKDASSGKIIESKLTDGSGVAQFQLKEGNYIYQETSGLKGYIIDNKEQHFNISNNNLLIEKRVVNQSIKGSLEITKVDEENKKTLPGAMFIIKDENGFIIRKETSDQNGIAKFENLPYGKYTYKEIFAPEGYEIDLNEYQFEIKELDEKIKVTCENKKETIVANITDDKNIIDDKNNLENKYNDKKKNLNNKVESLSNRVDSKFDSKSDSTNNSLEKSKNLVSPATGDTGIWLYITLGAISVIVLYLLNRKKDIK